MELLDRPPSGGPLSRRTHRRRAGLAAPFPLLFLFVAFLAAIGYLVAASLVRRTAPVYPPSPTSRERRPNWERAGDTLTVDASDGDRWQYVSLGQGHVLALPDTAGWDIAIQRYRVISAPLGAIADLGPAAFENASLTSTTRFVSTTGYEHPENLAIEHWYRYNFLTHLLEPNGHVFAIRAPTGALWKLAVVSYYCPKLEAGCLTVRYAPLALGS